MSSAQQSNQWPLFLISLTITLLLCWSDYAVVSSIKSPVKPAPISLPIGEHNRTESLRLESNYEDIAEAYLIKYNVTLSTLPSTAWCEESGQARDSEFALWCVWPTPNAHVRFAAGRIDVPVPVVDGLKRWDFDAAKLQAVPVMKGWLSYNFDRLVGVFFLSIFALFGALLTFVGFMNLLEVITVRRDRHAT